MTYSYRIMPLTLSDQELLLKMLLRRHPDYAEKEDHWEFLEETYKGGREWFKKHIFRYHKEGDVEFKARLERAFRFNHTREVVDLVNKYIFKQCPTRNEKDASEEIKAFWENATLSGLEIDEFMKIVSSASSSDGRSYIFVDTTNSEANISVAEAKQKGARAYAYVVRAKDALDMGFDHDTGAMNWILVREYHRDDANPIASSGDVEELYRLWTREEWVLFRIKQKKTSAVTVAIVPATSPTLPGDRLSDKMEVEIVDQGLVAIGQVPCIPVDHVIGENLYSSPSLIDDIAYLDRAIANYLSNLDAIIQDQTFSQLAMPAQAAIIHEKYDQLVEMGTKRIFLYDGEGGGKPEFLSPDVKQAQLIVDTINKIIHEIYHSAGMAGERTKQDNAVGIDNSSGVAKGYDFERLNALLKTKGSSLEVAENKLVALVEKMHGKKDLPKDELVEYPETYDVRSLFDEFTVAERLALVDAPQIIRRLQMKQVQDKLFPVQSEEDKKKIEKELEKWPPQIEAMPAPPSRVSGSSPAKRNPQTQSRQGQVTSQTK
jgi:hypothetical protein